MKARTALRKPLLGFITLALVMACLPAAATPVPTLDPNTISTIIAQTEKAAATQTASAPTLTATVTPLNTATLIPTFTNIAPIILPSPTLIPIIQYFRVKHDMQLEQYNYKSRTGDNSWPVEAWGLQTPEVFPMSIQLGLPATRRTTMDGIWDKYIDELNDHDRRKIAYVKASDTALFNGTGFPQMESLTMGGNLITLDEIRDGWGRVHTLNYEDPEKLEEFTYKTRPDLIHKFVVVGWRKSTKQSILVNPPPGDLYWPLVCKSPVWMPMKWLEPFPFLPMEVTANITQPIRANPSTDEPVTSAELSEGETATVIDYFPTASDVWGKLSGGGWIALLLHEKGPSVYLTSWKMETKPPIPPAR